MNDRLPAPSDAPARAPWGANVADVLQQQRDEEREHALRALLMRPLLPAGDPACALVRRHADYLRDFFDRECGWPLAVQRDAVRLYKRPADATDATRGAPEFGRARYLLLCLVCMVLERSDPQITLRALAERLLEAAADPSSPRSATAGRSSRCTSGATWSRRAASCSTTACCRASPATRRRGSAGRRKPMCCTT